uniref:Uncharacterized protein n=1 Tax=Arundo donax TaxID=35708 RepID=A0A0A9GNQ0_ARUDO
MRRMGPFRLMNKKYGFIKLPLLQTCSIKAPVGPEQHFILIH